MLKATETINPGISDKDIDRALARALVERKELSLQEAKDLLEKEYEVIKSAKNKSE